MTADPLEAKAHGLLGRLGPGKLAAVVQLLEVMIDDEPVTEDDRRRYRDGSAWFAQRGGKGSPMDEVLAEFGLTAEDFPVG